MLMSVFMWLLWWRGICIEALPFDKWFKPWWGDGFNPPSINLMVFALITLIFCYTFFSLLDGSGNVLIKRGINALTWVGRNTLYIFMYHLLVREIEYNICVKMRIELNGVVDRGLFLTGMLVLPIIGKEIVIRVLRVVKPILQDV